MTIAHEEPELLVAVCDGCGERRVLDMDHSATDKEILVAFDWLGWVRRKPVKQKFPTVFRTNTVTYDQDFCGDCQNEEPKPKPVFGAGYVRHPRATDAFDNDPHDGWPWSLIFAAVGLRTDCGHPAGGHPCPHCAAGLPIGEVRPAWQR